MNTATFSGKKISQSEIVDFSFEGTVLLIAIEGENDYKEYDTYKFWAWFEVAHPEVCEEYKVQVECNVEDEYYNESDIDKDAIRDILTHDDMAMFINHTNIIEEMWDKIKDPLYVDKLIETIKNVKAA